ncbi:MAG: histidine triad nucleotide-binding protein [Dehalococcoidia bacterium]|nr:MAG: histidine triad nucleotide-binding protein [Dehalococcoidia bacterium]
MPEECIFCRIAAGEVPSDIVYQDEDFVAFRDIFPQAPTHVLIIPKTHITSAARLMEGQQELAGRLIMIARKLAEKEGIAERGYRLVINCGSQGGQQVPHLHLHLIGGRQLSGGLG